MGVRAYCHSIPDAREGKRVGRVARYFSMLWRASIAEPWTVVSLSFVAIWGDIAGKKYLQQHQAPHRPVTSAPTPPA